MLLCFIWIFIVQLDREISISEKQSFSFLGRVKKDHFMELKFKVSALVILAERKSLI